MKYTQSFSAQLKPVGSHPEMQCALRKILKSVTAILENEAADGDPTAMGLLQQLRKPFLPCAFSLMQRAKWSPLQNPSGRF